MSEDESTVKPHRRSIKAQPARSLNSQHSDVASQLGQHDHRLCKFWQHLHLFSSVSCIARLVLTAADLLAYDILQILLMGVCCS